MKYLLIAWAIVIIAGSTPSVVNAAAVPPGGGGIVCIGGWGWIYVQGNPYYVRC